MHEQLTLTADPASARAARRFVREALHRWHLEQVSFEAELLVSELVTNAVLHAGTAMTVVVSRTDEQPLHVAVQDGSARAPRRRRYSEQATTGRGLVLVEQLASAFGVQTGTKGKTVWFELEVPHRDLPHRDLPRRDLPRRDLPRRDRSRVDLQGVDMTGADVTTGQVGA